MAEQAEQDQAPDFLEMATKECSETIIQMAGVGGAESAGSLAGLLIAVFRELFERLAVVERALMALASEPTGPTESSEAGVSLAPADDALYLRALIDEAAPLPPAPPPSPPAPFYPISTSPIAQPAQHMADSTSILTPTSEARPRQAESIPVQAQTVFAPDTQVPPPPPIAENPEIAALEARLAALRARRQAATVAAPVASAAPRLRYEVRHADGALVGRGGVNPVLIFHDSFEQAQMGVTSIEADHPGWRGRLSIHEVMQ